MRRHRSLRHQRGVTAVVVAVVITVLLGFLALGMDVGHSRMVRGQLQNACDAASLAGARALDGTAAGVLAARAAAVDYAARHVTDANATVQIDPSADVEVGHWDFSLPRDSAFTPLTGATASELRLMNAVLVRAGRDSSRGNAVPVWMAGILGLGTMNVTSQAVAVGGGPRTLGCPVPIVLPSCAFAGYTCGKTMTFSTDGTLSSDGVDTIGFTNLAPPTSTDTASNERVREILNGNQCIPTQEGESIGIQNGSDLNKPTFQALQDFLTRNGNTVHVPVVEFDDCTNPKFNQTATVVGFATVTITLPSSWAKTIVITGTLDCPDTGAPPGGGFFGMSPKPGLVQ